MRILIVGASGYLGNTIYKKFKERGSDEIYGTCCNSASNELMTINVLNKSHVKKLILLKPDIIIWSIYDPEQEISLSQIGLNEIVNSISEHVRLIYVSTTVGQDKDQSENVIQHKRSEDEYFYKYINGKIEGENIVKKHSNHLIVRPGSIYGYDYDGKMDSRMKALFKLSKTGKKYSRTANIYSSYVNVEDLSDAIIELACKNITGIINISGEKPVSYYDFYVYLAKLQGIDSSFIIPDYKEKDGYHNLDNDKRKLLLSTRIREIF